MAMLKCKMCGGELKLMPDVSTAECEYCGSVQTVPKADDDKKLTLFGRANRLRSAGEFDKAAGVYEAIVADFPEEAEAYWGLVLCRYGIEYVDDPATGKKVPTCHRSSYESVMDDTDFEQTLENADSAARKVYREEARQIEELRKGIIAVSAKEEAYDIFICYKETAENGERTLDSVLAQDVYDALKEKGYRVFFSRITLEDKLGMEYEPYIFAALNSAKVMLAFGTDYEYFNAVWVKNEWSRFMKLMATNKDKYLIPCYKGIDAYDMPKEFAKLQAQDLGKVGAVQDLLRGIEKLLPKKEPEETKVIVKEVVREIVREQVVVEKPAPEVEAQLQRGWDLLKARKWEEADAQFERVLDMDGKCAKAYLGKLCVKYEYLYPEQLRQDDDKIKSTKMINGYKATVEKQRYASSIFCSTEYKRALEYADDKLRAELEGYESTRRELRLRREYREACALMERREYGEAARAFERLKNYQDSEELVLKCRQMSQSDADAELCKRLAEIRRRNAPVQQQMIYGMVGTNCRPNHYAADNWGPEIKLISCVRSEFCREKKQDPTKLYVPSYQREERFWIEYGLTAKGTVESMQPLSCDAHLTDPLRPHWENIVRLFSGYNRLFALDKEGNLHVETLKYDDPYKKLQEDPQWKGLADLTAESSMHTVLGLKPDGTVVVNDDKHKGEYKHWKNIAALCPGSVSIAVTADGRLVARSNTTNIPQEIFRWTEIVAVAKNYIALKADGTVCVPYTYKSDFYDKLENIVAISADGKSFVRADGLVLSTDKDINDAKLRLFQNIDTVKQERRDIWNREIQRLEALCREHQAGIEANKGLFHRSERQRFEKLLYETRYELECLQEEQVNL